MERLWPRWTTQEFGRCHKPPRPSHAASTDQHHRKARLSRPALGGGRTSVTQDPEGGAARAALGRVVLVRRARHPDRDQFALVGRRLEPAEWLDEAPCRGHPRRWVAGWASRTSNSVASCTTAASGARAACPPSSPSSVGPESPATQYPASAARWCGQTPAGRRLTASARPRQRDSEALGTCRPIDRPHKSWCLVLGRDRRLRGLDSRLGDQPVAPHPERGLPAAGHYVRLDDGRHEADLSR